MEGAVILLFWFVLAFLIGAWASSRGRSGVGFGLLSFVFSPLLAAIVLLVMADKKAEATRETEKRREHEAHIESIRAIASRQPEQEIATPKSAAVALSVADELEKLAALRDKGVLSEEEFQGQKAALLGGSVAA